MRFPLADWVDGHADCRHNLALSGMRGALPMLWPRAGRPAREAADVLREELARELGVAPDRLFLTHGATEANSWVLFYLARRSGGRTPTCRVRYPEYPPLFSTARAAGFRLVGGERPTDVAVVSRPRNPEGDLWPDDQLARWSGGARELLVDETFREFARVPSVTRDGRPRVWATGSFTKFFGADDLRVGFAVAPPERAESFGQFVGLLSDQLAPSSASGALALVRELGAVRGAVERVLAPNRAAYRRAYPGVPLPAAPFYFEPLRGEDGDRLARRCLAASVLVCPGSFFGAPRGVRVCLTRRSFPRDLRAYEAVRGPPVSRGRRGAIPSG